MSALASPLMVLISAALGFLLRRTPLGRYADPLGKLNIYAFLTVILTNSFYRKGLGISDAQVLASYLFFLSISSLILPRALRGVEPAARASIMSTSLFPNAVNLAFPLLQATRQNYHYASVYAVAVILTQAVVMPLLLVGEKRRILNNLRGFAPLAGVLLGLSMRSLPQLSLAAPALEVLSDVGILMFGLVAGLSIPLGCRLTWSRHLALVGAWRTVASPFLHSAPFLLMMALGFDVNREALAQTLVESVMPPALVNISYAIALGFDVKLSVSSVLLLTPIGALAGVVFSVLL